VTYADRDGTALSALLGGEGVRKTEVGTPVTATDGDDAELGNDDSGADSGGNFLGGLDTETDVTLGITNEDDGLEPGALTGTGLLLDGLDLFSRKEKSVSNCSLFAMSSQLVAVAFAIGARFGG
jgi:hypothetical protein